ncbi:MAG: hypothetical protein O2954_07605, partial [bacterium]|nr:hypothetical protein [bacterium]
MICNRSNAGTSTLRNVLIFSLFLLPVSTPAAEQPAYDSALQNAHQARLALQHAHAFLRYWTAHKDSRTALIATGPGRDRWTVRGTATEIYPTMVCAAYLTDLPFFDGLLRETLRDETRLTTRISGLPDDYDLNTGRFLHTAVDTERIVAAAAEYAASGLLPITSCVGNDVWTDRLEQLVQAIFTLASVQTTFSNGPLPSEYAETNGNLLRVLPWLATHTGNPTYLEWARRIADAYCLGVLPSNGGLPAHHWDFSNDRARNPALILNHAGRVLIEGLTSLYATEVRLNSGRADIYRPTLSYMFDILLTRARNPEGFFYARIEPDSRGGYSIDRKARSSEWSH